MNERSKAARRGAQLLPKATIHSALTALALRAVTSSTSAPPAVPESTAPAPTAAKPLARASLRLFGIRVLNYVTNHVVAHLPSYSIRHAWYRRVLGIDLGRGAGVHLGCYVWFYGPGAIRRKMVRIGKNSHINRDCTLDVRGGLTIGENVSVSAEVSIITSAKLTTNKERSESKPVVIEDNVWIGMRAMIMPGVTIGRGAVVGAGSVVLRDVPALSIVFGSPARPVGTRSPDEADYALSGSFPLFE